MYKDIQKTKRQENVCHFYLFGAKTLLLVSLLFTFLLSVNAKAESITHAQAQGQTKSQAQAQIQTPKWQLLLQAPEQMLWLGQASEWLLISSNQPESNNAFSGKLSFPKNKDFSFETGAAITVNYNGAAAAAYPLRITPKSSGNLTLPSISLTLANSTVKTAPMPITVAQAKQSKHMQLSVEHSAKEIYLGQSVRLNIRWQLSYPVNALQAVQFYIPEFYHPDISVVMPWNQVNSSDNNAIGLPISGKRIIGKWQALADNKVQIDAQVLIKPTKAGQYHFAAPHLQVNVNQNKLAKKRKRFAGAQYPAYFNNNFFESKPGSYGETPTYVREQTRGNAFTLTVKSLPTPAPDNFTGIIGKPDINASASPTTLNQGEPLQYSLTLVHPDLETIDTRDLSQVASFNRSFDIPSPPSPATYQAGVKTIHQSIFPRRADIEAIPEYAISYFDPITGLYRELDIAAIAIEVNENVQFNFSQGQSSDALNIKNRLTKDDSGIWAHYWNEQLFATTNPTFFSLNKAQIMWLTVSLILTIPPLIVVFLLAKPLFERRQQALMQQPYFRLKTQLNAQHEPLSALSNYAQQRLNIAPSQFNALQVKQAILALAKNGNNSSAAKLDILALQLFDWINRYQTQYSSQKASVPEPKAVNVSELISLIAQLEQQLPQFNITSSAKVNSSNTLLSTLLMIGLLFLPVDNVVAEQTSLAQPSISEQIQQLQQAHQHALQLSIDSPQKASVAHSKIAQQLTEFVGNKHLNQATLMYNIASSWHHAGQYGDSILWFRRAENSEMQNSAVKNNAVSEQIAHNLQQTRNKRLDDLPDFFAPTWLIQLQKIAGNPLWQGISLLCYLWFLYLLVQRVKRDNAGKGFYHSAALLTVCLISQVLYFSYQPLRSDGVITRTEVVSRKGPGLIFSPAFTTPLNQGTEVILKQRQGNWSQVQLSDFSTVWLPSKAISWVNDLNHASK